MVPIPTHRAPAAPSAPETPLARSVRPDPVVVPEAAPPETPATVLDLNEIPHRKATFLITDEEFEALEDLKLSVRRTLDVRVTKEDLARCAIVYMVEDFKRHREASPVIDPLRKRRGR